MGGGACVPGRCPDAPEVTQERGSRYGYHCAANIWCCPTPVVMMASPLVSSPSTCDAASQQTPRTKQSRHTEDSGGTKDRAALRRALAGRLRPGRKEGRGGSGGRTSMAYWGAMTSSRSGYRMGKAVRLACSSAFQGAHLRRPRTHTHNVRSLAWCSSDGPGVRALLAGPSCAPHARASPGLELVERPRLHLVQQAVDAAQRRLDVGAHLRHARHAASAAGRSRHTRVTAPACASMAPQACALRQVGELAKPSESLTGTCAVLFLPISAASMSMCTMRARCAKASSLPVTRSSNRTPSAMSRSACTPGGAWRAHPQTLASPSHTAPGCPSCHPSATPPRVAHLVHGVVGVHGAVHAQHLQALRVVRGEHAQALRATRARTPPHQRVKRLAAAAAAACALLPREPPATQSAGWPAPVSEAGGSP